MNILPSCVPTTDAISTSVETDMSVAYILISLCGRLFGPTVEATDKPTRRMDTGVHITMTEVISSTNTPGLGFTTATLVMTSGWSTNELMSCLWCVRQNYGPRGILHTHRYSPREIVYGLWISRPARSREEDPCGT